MLNLSPSWGHIEQVLRPSLLPGHRPATLACEGGDNDVFRIGVAFGSESSPDCRCDYPDATRFEIQGSCDRQLDVPGKLGGHPDAKTGFVAVWYDQNAVRLQGNRSQLLVDKRGLHDHVRVLKHRGVHQRLDFVCDFAAVLGRDHGWERLNLHIHVAGQVFRLCRSSAGDHCERIADIADLVERQQIPCVSVGGRRPRHELGQTQRRGRVKVSISGHPHEVAVGNRGANEAGVKSVAGDEVCGERTAARQQPPVLDAKD